MMLPDNNDRYKTQLGACLSVLTIIVMLSFASYKMSVLLTQSDYKVLERSEADYFESTDEFGVAQHFQVAAGLTTFDNTSEVLDDPAYGTLKFYSVSWNDTSGGNQFRELKTRFCSKDDLNDIGDSNP